MQSLKGFSNEVQSLKREQQKYLDLRNSNRATKKTRTIYTQKALDLDEKIERLKG